MHLQMFFLNFLFFRFYNCSYCRPTSYRTC